MNTTWIICVNRYGGMEIVDYVDDETKLEAAIAAANVLPAVTASWATPAIGYQANPNPNV